MPREEQVLVIERKVLEQVGMFQGLTFDVDNYLGEIFVQGVPRFMPRSQVEENPAYKQLIPYVLMSYQDKYLSYIRGRRAGEARLVGNRSIGIGGHINPVDWTLFSAEPYKTYLEAVEREVAEEVCVETSHTDRIVALLRDGGKRDAVVLGRLYLRQSAGYLVTSLVIVAAARRVFAEVVP